MLIGNNVGTKADFIPRLTDPIVHFVVLGASEGLVEKTGFFKNLSAVRSVEKRFYIPFLAVSSKIGGA